MIYGGLIIMKKKSFGLKVFFILLVIGILLIANVFIGQKILDRSWVYDGAVQNINQSAGDSFCSNRLVICVPYELYFVDSKGNRGSKNKDEFLIFYPNSVDYKCNFQTEERKLGIYSAPVFTGILNVEADFSDIVLPDYPSHVYHPEDAYIIYDISDTNIMERPVFIQNGKEKQTYYTTEGLCSKIDLDKNVKIKTSVKIKGAAKMVFNINALAAKVHVDGDWASPGFTGYSHLPDIRKVTENGFSADWNIAFGSISKRTQVGFDFISPVNLYDKLRRANTYAFLFILVPFIVLFLFEICASVTLHPMNYLLCGAASVIFFLLLLSLSEHINFIVSYVLGALASGILISVYTAMVTKKYKLGSVMALICIILYGYLMVCLMSEDYALLMGAIFAFIVLASVMFITRKVDWTNLNKTEHTDLIEA